jgi:hypothetical protein
VCYVGLLPVLSAIGFGAMAVITGRRVGAPWKFIALAGAISLLLALPWWHAVMQRIPGTILRSPARQIYITTFALAMSAAAGVNALLADALRRKRRWLLILLVLALAVHAWDLGWMHDRAFVVSIAFDRSADQREENMLREQVGSGRIGIDYTIWKRYNRQIDDVGFFESIMLARPYRAMMEVNGAEPGLNTQQADGGQLFPRALQFFAVNTLLTRTARPDLINMEGGLYGLNPTMPRVSLISPQMTQYLSEPEIHQRLKDPGFDFINHLLLPSDAPRPPADSAGTAGATAVLPSLKRELPSTDEIVIHAMSPAAVYLRLIDTWDPGWSATVDGAPAPLICAYETFMAVPLSAGAHEVRLKFATPGAAVGLTLSACSLVLLLLLLKTLKIPVSE